MRNKENGSNAISYSWMKRFLALICVAFMLATDLPDTAGWMRNVVAEETQTVSATPEATPPEQPVEEAEETPAETLSVEPEETPAEVPSEPDEAPAEAPSIEPEETPAETSAEPEETPEEPEFRPDAVMSVNQAVTLSIGRGETHIVSLKVKKREEVRVTAEGLPVVIRARNDETGAGASFRSREEDGKLTDRLESTWKVVEGTYTLTVSAAETNGKGNLTLRVESIKKSGGAVPAADPDKDEAEPEAAEEPAEEPADAEPAEQAEPEAEILKPEEPIEGKEETAADEPSETITDDEAQPEEGTPAEDTTETEPDLSPEETDAQDEPTEAEPAEDPDEEPEAPAEDSTDAPAADKAQKTDESEETEEIEEEKEPEFAETPAEPEQIVPVDDVEVVLADDPENGDDGNGEKGDDDPEADPGKPEFENTFFIENEAPLNGVKKLQNRAFKPGDSFIFEIKPLDGAPKPVTKTTAEDGTVIRTPFSSVTVTPTEGTQTEIDMGWFHFTSDDLEDVEWNNNTKVKTFKYEITERIPANAVNADGKAYADATDAEKETDHFLTGDFSYDARTYTVTFTVTITLDENTGSAAMTVKGDKQGSDLTFTNIYVGQYCVAVSKLWKDENNRDGLRPGKLYVELLQSVADGEPAVYQTGIELSDANGWTYLVRGVPTCDAEGRTYIYTWKEYAEDEDGKRIDVNSGKITFATGGEYTLTEKVIQTVDPEDSTSAMVVTELTNTHAPDTVDVRATKVWDDENNRDGLRDDIRLKLSGAYTADGRTYAVENIADAVKTIAKTATGDALTVTWTGLPKFYGGESIVYTVTEAEPPEGYTAAYFSDSGLTETVGEGELTWNEEDEIWEVWVENKHTVNAVKISATKVWNDGNAPAVHGTVKLTLSAVPSVEITEAEKTIDGKALGEGLVVTWAGLPEYKDGEKVVYTVTETQGDARYTAEIGNITYTYDADGKLITGTVTVTNTPVRNMLKVHKAFSFKGTALDLSKLTDAQKEKLTFVITTELDGTTYYVAKDTETTAAQGNIHGKYAKLTTTAFTFTYKDFSDGMLVLENLPAGVYTVTENGADMIEGYRWSTATWQVGRGGTVTTVEDPASVAVPEAVVGSGDFTQVFLTNEYTEKTGHLKVLKTVSAGENDVAIDTGKVFRVAVYRLMKDGKDDPEGTKVYYTTNGRVVTDSDAAITDKNLWVELKAGADNAQLWKNFPVGTYYVEEDAASAAVTGYDLTTAYSPEGIAVTEASLDSAAVVLTVSNVYEQQRGKLKVSKRVFVDNKEITADTTDSEVAGFVTKPFYVEVAYVDANGNTWYVTDSSGTLQKNPPETPLQMTLQMALTISDAPVGEYTVREVDEQGRPVADGAEGTLKLVTAISRTEDTAEVTLTADGEAEIINRYTSAKFAVAIRKVWDDDGDRDKVRPEKITVSLYRSTGSMWQNLLDWFMNNGTLVGRYELNEDNNWTQVVTGLPRYGMLGVYNYRWFEPSVPEGYTATVGNPVASADGMTQITTITNTHIPAKVQITAGKVWKNRDEDVTAVIKNAAATFTLQQKTGDGDWQFVVTDAAANGAGNPVTLSTADTADTSAWTVTWTNLLKLNAGKEIQYRVTESDVTPEGATAESNPVAVTVTEGSAGKPAQGTATLVNTLPVTSVKVIKIWEDNDDQDGFRPENVKVQLMNGETKVGDAVTLQAAETEEEEGWQYTWTDVPKYNNDGTLITYSVVEVDDEGETLTAIEKDGQAIYTVSVAEIDADGVITVTNTHDTELTSVRITKVWDDADDQDGIRPQTVNIYLDRQVGDGAVEKGYRFITLSRDDKVDGEKWTVVFDGLPMFEDGKAVTYTVREDRTAGYDEPVVTDVTDAEDEGQSVEVTNTHKPAVVTVSVTKKWDDDEDRDKVRPTADEYKAKVHLLADGTVVTAETAGYADMTTAVTDNGDGTFTVTFGALPKFKAGAEIAYSVKEDEVTGYTADPAEAAAGGTIVNIHELERTSLTITKVWQDGGNHDGQRPDPEAFKAALQLLAGNDVISNETAGYEPMTLTVTEGENNSYVVTYSGLLKYEDGEPIVYTVNESTVPEGYSIVNAEGEPGESKASDGGTIINKKENELISVAVTKVWADGDDRDGKRPTAKEFEAMVHLLADGTEVTAETEEYGGMTRVVTDNGDGTYTVTFGQLPKFKAGAEIVYTVKEDAITGYTTDTPVAAVGGTIVNTHIPARYCVAVVKNWIDLDNRFHSRPTGALTVTLQKSSDGGTTWADVETEDGEALTAELTEANGWAYMEQGLPAFEDGKTLVYRWTEKNVPAGYVHTEDDERNVQNGTLTLRDGSEFKTDILTVLTNTLDLVQVPVTKTWNDDNDRDGKRPGAVTVRLFKTVGTVKTGVGLFTLSEADAEVEEEGKARPWSHVFTDLPKYEGDALITYTVEEDAVPDYTSEVTGDDEDGFNVVNSHAPKSIDIRAKKQWNDANNRDGKRAKVTLVLSGRYVDGEGKAHEVSLANAETGDAIPAEQTIELTDETSAAVWSKLYKYENGHEIEYTVSEKGMAEDHTIELNGATYYVAVAGNAADGFTVINSYVPQEYAVAVSKTWEDMDDRYETRPTSLTVTLQKSTDGENWTDTGITAELKNDNGWAAIQENLPAYEDGKLLRYRWTEKDVPARYEKTREETVQGRVIINGTAVDADLLTTLTNTLKTVNVRVTKNWMDEYDADHLRPNTLEVKLFGSDTGNKVLAKVLLAPANSWTAEVTELPAFDADGKEIVYTWDETDANGRYPAGYRLTVTGPQAQETDGVAYQQTTLTNTHTVKRTQVTITKQWTGDDHRAAERSAVFQLMADGKAVRDPVTLTGGEDQAEASYTWTKLPVYSDPATMKKEIAYTVEEINPAPYYNATSEITGDAENGYVVTFVNTQQVGDLKVSKHVVSDADADQDLAFDFTVTLTPAIAGTFGDMTFDKQGVATFSLKDGETMTATGLPAGIDYIVEETPVENFVTAAVDDEGTLPETDEEAMEASFTNTRLTSGFIVTKKVDSALTKDQDPAQTRFDFKVTLTGATVTGTYGDMDFTDGVAEFTLGHGESKAAEDLPVGITYTVEETPNENFTTEPESYSFTDTITVDQSGTAAFVNRRKTGSLKIGKTVVSPVEGDQNRLFAFKVTLKNGDQLLSGVYSTYTFGEEGEARIWLKAGETVTITGIPLGTEYTIEEVPDPDGLFTAKPTSAKAMLTLENPDQEQTFENTRKTGTLQIVKTVENPVLVDGKPETDNDFLFVVTVDPAIAAGTYGDAEFSEAGGVSTATVTIKGNGSATITGLPQGVSYRVVEVTDDAYEKTVETGNVGVISEVGSKAEYKNVRRTTGLKVVKKWADADNQDGKRAEVEIELLKNGTVIDVKTLNASGAAEWTDLPATELNGKAITYTYHEKGETDGIVVMKDGAEYQVTYEGNTVTNAYTPETTSLSVYKVWDDADDQDGKRERVNARITLYKTREGEETHTAVETVDVPYVGGLVKTWDNLPVYEQGKKLVYSVQETLGNTSLNYTSDLNGETVVENGGSVTVTNSYTPEVTQITIRKVWDDAEDQDGKRVGALASATLYRKPEGGEREPVDVITVGLAEDWSKTWENLPVYQNGKKLTYSVLETAGNGYTVDPAAETTVENGSELTITNTYKPEETEISIRKLWDDAEDQDGLRAKAGAKVALYSTDADGAKTLIEEVTVPVTDGEIKKWEHLPVYSKGQKLTYTATETLAEESGYVSSQAAEGEIKNGELLITNHHTPAVTESGVQKFWDDADDQDGVRPDSVTMHLYKTVNGQKTEVLTLTLAKDDQGLNEAWTYLAKDLPAYEKGQEITYTWEETVPAEYELTKTEVTGTTTKLTNHHEPALTEATIRKVWDDADNQDGARPASLTVTLSDGTAVTLNEENDWTQTVTDLPKYSAGKEIDYTWTEGDMPEGYTLTSMVRSGLVTTLTNSYTPKTTEVSVTKVWDDKDDIAGLRKQVAAVITLSRTDADNVMTVIETVVVPAADGVVKTWKNLPVYDRGKELVYSVQETLLNDFGYTTDTAEAKAIEGGSATVTNTYVPELTEASVEKLWMDQDNLNGKRPTQLVVKLLADGEDTGRSVILNEENDWSDTIDKLMKYKDGKEIDYTWAESPVMGYDAQASYRNGSTTTLINSLAVETVTVSVHKVWVDGDNLDGTRPPEITMTLSNGDTVTLNEGNGWSASISGLPKYEGDQEIVYTWSEPEVEGYTSAVTSEEGSAFTVFTNTHIPKLGTMSAAKMWDDAENQDGKRFEVTFQLISHIMDDEGTETTSVVDERSLGQEDGSYQWNDLPLITEDGRPIFYTVTEKGMSEDGRIGDYTVSASGTMADGFLVTNHYKPITYCVAVTKHWDDQGNRERRRPESLIVHLSSTAGLEKDVELNEANGWSYVERGVPMYMENGTKIEYTWTEPEIKGYKSTTVVAQDGVITSFTNIHTISTGGGSTPLGGKKTWVDDDNKEGKRPDSIIINLYGNDELVESRRVTAADNWSWSFPNLPQKDKDGKAIIYTITEDEVPGYTATVNGMDVVNVYTPDETVSTSVVKIWDDNSNEAGLRPASLRVTLSDGTSYQLNDANGWTITVDGLPKYDEDGAEITYTWSEQSVPGYKRTDTITAGTTTVFINTCLIPHEPEEDLPHGPGFGTEINHVGDCYD